MPDGANDSVRVILDFSRHYVRIAGDHKMTRRRLEQFHFAKSFFNHSGHPLSVSLPSLYVVK
jgi:hypothetical protein